MRGLLAWYLVQPSNGGATWWNLLGRYHGTLLNMGAGSGWQATSRQGWGGGMRFDGSNDAISLGNLPIWDFSDTTFAVSVRFRTTSATTQTLVAFRTTSPGSGGYFIRVNAGGSLTARLLFDGASTLADYTTAATSYTNGQWHSVIVVFRTDSTVVANNDLAMYGDGVVDQVATTPTATTGYRPCTVVVPTCALMLGTTFDGVQPFNGSLDDVWIWTRNILPAEALAYHRQTPPEYGGMVLPDVPLALVVPAPVVKRKVVIQ